MNDNVNPAPRTVTEERWGIWDKKLHIPYFGVMADTEEVAMNMCRDGEIPVRVTLTYTVPEEGR